MVRVEPEVEVDSSDAHEPDDHEPDADDFELTAELPHAMEGGTEVKVLMVGPKGSGKSALANYIADAVQNSETPSQAFPETKGVRIVEFDRKVRGKKGTVARPPEPRCAREAPRACAVQWRVWAASRVCAC